MLSIMKHLKKILLGLALAAGTFAASAQYAQIANELSDLVRPALSGSGSYRGFVEATGTAGFGTNRANIIGISTSQGYQYLPWFYMGGGIGVDVMMTNPDESATRPTVTPAYMNHASARTVAMVPIFTDFRIKFGDSNGGPAVYIDLKTGASWIMGSRYLEFTDARLGGGTQFYMRPSVGVRIPISKKYKRQAVNVGVAYQLITSNNSWYSPYSDSATLNGVGATVSFEW